jgi:hypothetical protein
LDTTGEHQLARVFAQAVVDAGGLRVVWVGESDGGGEDRGHDVTIAFDIARAGVPPLGEGLLYTPAAEAVL